MCFCTQAAPRIPKSPFLYRVEYRSDSPLESRISEKSPAHKGIVAYEWGNLGSGARRQTLSSEDVPRGLFPKRVPAQTHRVSSDVAAVAISIAIWFGSRLSPSPSRTSHSPRAFAIAWLARSGKVKVPSDAITRSGKRPLCHRDRCPCGFGWIPVPILNNNQFDMGIGL